MTKPRATCDPLRRVKAFRKTLHEWFARDPRDYPWRRTQDPWAVLVSEVMLQQTQVATVLGRGFFSRFMERFPTPAALAAASEPELLKAWEGLGYYRRARMLQATARALVETHAGRFPADAAQLRHLPGIGRYTAGAVASFAFDLPEPVVDGNIARVLARLFDFQTQIDSSAGQRQLWDWAGALLDPAAPRRFNSAIMELGQRVCRPGQPLCATCPVASFCQTRHPHLLPRKKPPRAWVELVEHALWQYHPTRGLVLEQESGTRRRGLWRLPTRSAAEVADFPLLATRHYTITHHKVTLHVHAAPATTSHPPGALWQPRAALAALAMPAPFRRIIDELLANELPVPPGAHHGAHQEFPSRS